MWRSGRGLEKEADGGKTLALQYRKRKEHTWRQEPPTQYHCCQDGGGTLDSDFHRGHNGQGQSSHYPEVGPLELILLVYIKGMKINTLVSMRKQQGTQQEAGKHAFEWRERLCWRKRSANPLALTVTHHFSLCCHIHSHGTEVQTEAPKLGRLAQSH